MSPDKVFAVNAGQRERAALMRYWDRLSNDGQTVAPFWKYLERTVYNPHTDSFTLPDGEVISVQEINEGKP